MMSEGKELLVINELEIGYKTHSLISPFSMKANEGELIGLMGLNGTGKTTLFKTILREIQPLGGRIVINQKEIEVKNLQHSVSVVYTDRVSIFGFSVTDMVAMGRMPYTNRFGKLLDTDKHIITHYLKELDLTSIADKQINELSDGQFQKVMIARALVQETPLLLLDEPTAFLDVKNKLMIYKVLKELTQKHNKTIIVSTHHLEFCNEFCDKIWLINKKELTERYPGSISEKDFD